MKLGGDAMGDGVEKCGKCDLKACFDAQLVFSSFAMKFGHFTT